MKKKRLKIYIEVLFIIAAILWIFHEVGGRFYLPLSEPDEAAWIYSGYYFNLYFLKFDLSHADWADYDAYDHPPLVKYIIGGTLFLKGYVFDSLDAKKLWRSIPMDQYLVNYRLMKSKFPDQILPLTRFVIFSFAFLSLVFLYLFTRNSYGILPAIVCTSLLITNEIFIRLSTQTIADPVLLLFFISFVWLCSQYIRSSMDIYIFGGFILSSLAFLTKLNGLILIFALFFALLLKNRFSIRRYQYKILVLGFVSFLFIVVLLNPFFIKSGVQGFVKMVEHRVTHLKLQQETFKLSALPSLGERLKAEIDAIFFKYSKIRQFTGIPLELILFLVGVCYLLLKRDLILFMILIFFVGAPLSVLPINWVRYYYTVIPFVYVISATSLNLFKKSDRTLFQMRYTE
jgi:hypothetical protein